MVFNANAEQITLRAIEVAIEQRARFQQWIATHDSREALDFYHQPQEVETSAKLNDFMVQVGVLRGIVKSNQKLLPARTPRNE